MVKQIIGGVTRGGDGTLLPLSKVVRVGHFLFLSGQVPVDSSGQLVAGGIEEQTKQVLENVSALLAVAGARMTDVVKATAWLTDRSHFAGFNRVYSSYFPNEPPARTTVVSALVIDVLVEVEVVAYVGRSASV